MGIHLRNSIYLASRVSDRRNTDFSKLESDLQAVFQYIISFHSVNLSVWSTRHAVPFHTKQLVEDLGVVLGISPMKGRGSKRQQIASFAKFALV
jgi:hypothetical protein